MPKLLSQAEFPVESPEERKAAEVRARALLEQEQATGIDTSREIKRSDAVLASDEPHRTARMVKPVPIKRVEGAKDMALETTPPKAEAHAEKKIPKWKEISDSPKFQALDEAGRESVRLDYWANYVSPQIDTDDLEQARAEFDEITKTSLLKRAGTAAKKLLTQPPPAGLDESSMKVADASAAPKPAPRSTGDPELDEFYNTTELTDRIFNPLVSGGKQVRYGIAGQAAAMAARNLLEFEAMRRGTAEGAVPRNIRALSDAEFQAGRDVRIEALDREIQRIVAYRNEIERIPTNPALTATANAGTVKEAIEQFWRDPLGVVMAVSLQSLPYSAAGLTAGTAGAVVAGPVGGAMGMGLGSFGAEYVNSVMDALEERGVDMKDPKALGLAFKDQALMAEVRQEAAVRGGIIGTFDALAFGVASKMLAPKALGPVAREVANVPAQLGVQAVSGAAGEAGAQLASTGEVGRPGEVLLEAVGELGTAPAEVAGMRGAVAARGRQPEAAGAPAAAGSPDARARAAQVEEAPQEPGREAIDAETVLGAEEPPAGPVEAPTTPTEPTPPAGATAAPAAEPVGAAAPAGEAPVAKPPEEVKPKEEGGAAAPASSEKPVSAVQKAQPAEPPKETGAQPASDIEAAAKGLKGIFDSPVDEKAHEAASSPHNDKPEPTRPQIEANNAPLGHPRVGGMEISTENPAGSVRRDIKHEPPQWEVKMKGAHYGYIRGTIGYDKDHLDIFVKEGTPEDWSGTVFVINQNKAGNGHFDEHKAMAGFDSEAEAREVYLGNFDDRARAEKLIRSIVPLELKPFKEWAYDKTEKGPRGGELKRPTITAYHGTHEADIDVFERKRGPAARQGFGSIDQIGHWFSATAENARRFGPNVLERRLDIRKPWVGTMDELVSAWQQVQGTVKGALAGKGDPETFRAWLKERGYDGLRIKGGEAGVDYYVALEPSQIRRDDATETGKRPSDDQPEHRGAAPRKDVPADQGEVRGGESAQAGDRDRDERGGEKPAPAQEPRAEAAKPGEALTAGQVKDLSFKFQGALQSGAYKTISEARMAAKAFLQRPIEPGTIAAKQVDEALELAVVLQARAIIKAMRGRGATDKEIYLALRDLYGRQPNLGVRTSTSISNQAYSTPVPLAFIASRLAGITSKTRVLEPAAGNGMLLIEADPDHAVANELNNDRASALRAQGFITTQIDATALPSMEPVDAVIANPPFGYVKDDRGRNREWQVDQRYRTNQVDHAIAMKALEALKDDGQAVLIVAAPNKLQEGEALADAYSGKALRAFYYSLYEAYNVVDHFTVSGDLYAKQGAAWPVDVVVIRGRGKSARNLPAADLPKLYESWESLTEKLDARFEEGSRGDRREGLIAPGQGKQPASGDARGVQQVQRGGARPGDRGPGGRGPVRSGPDREQHAPAGLAAGERDQRGGPAGRGDVRKPDRPADAKGDRADVATIVDEEFKALFGDLEKAPPRGAIATTQASAVAPGQGDQPPGPAGLARSAVKETVSGLDDVAEGLNALFGAPGRVGSGLQFDEETYAKAKPFFIEGVKHFRQAAADIRELVRMLLTELRTRFNMTVEALQRMKPYVVRFVQDVTAGRIQLEQAPIGPAPAARADRKRDVETEHQAHYEPRSQVEAIGTLVPINMRDSVKAALTTLWERHGDLDKYIARELGYDVKKLGDHFSAEQVDALALALDAIAKGSGFIIGDQTGVGKGRVVAGIIKWAIKNAKTPIFVTAAPNLYKDIYRDLVDIGMEDVNPIMTNAGESIPLTDDGAVVLKSKDGPQHNAKLVELKDSGSLGDHDVIFTTYPQMQTIKGGQRTARMDFLETFSRGGVVIFDESHNAGGAMTEKPGWDEDKLDRAKFARGMAGRADAVFYSSATYAKRPEVMDLYFKTDMHLAVDSIKSLAPAIRAGGVPLQQVVASMLAQAGQYVRRERSFSGLAYDTTITPVQRDVAERMSAIMRAVAAFDDIKKGAITALKKEVRAEAKTVTGDGSTGMAAVHSTNFTSIMHNMVDQMLLALKVVPAADMAIASAKRGEKPVLTVANTMGSFIDHYVEDHGLNTGDAIGISFRDLLLRYLERSREVLIKNAFGAVNHHRLTDGELGSVGTRFFNELKRHIEESDFSSIPLSPIDYLKAKVQEAGYKFGEITGREHMIDYTGETPTYRRRPGRERSIRGRNETISAFNNGQLDVLLLNQAGATGLSLHASEKVKDQRKRHMVIVQAERNIDTHMQMLGRVHRTGQVVVPSYAQLVADIPAEKRPAAVLAKKMASLNANTTGARGSAVTSKDVVDFMNEYGDEVAAQLMEDHPEWHKMMGRPLEPSESGEGLAREEAIRKLTGRIPLLPIAQQEQLYDLIESEYKDLIEEKDRMGENALEAKTLELEAKVIKTMPVFQGKGGESPFAQGAIGEVLDVKRLGKAFTADEVLAQLRANLDLPESATYLQIQTAGRQRSEETIDELGRNFRDYLQQTLDAARDKADAEAQRLRLQSQHDRLSDILASAYIGRLVTLKTGFGEVPAVVTKVEQKGAPKNPAALGTWKITFAVADAIRHVTLPASRLMAGQRLEANRRGMVTLESILSKSVAIDDYVTPDRLRGKSPLTVFDEAQSQSREERVIITGNLLAGFGQFKGGRIVNFRMADGTLRQGILMPQKFDLDKTLNEVPIEFDTANQAIGFLAELERQGKSGVVNSVEEKVFRVAKVEREDLYRISVAASREVGGRIYLDTKVLKAAGRDFVKAGGSMRLDVDGATAKATLQAIMDIGYRVHTTAFRQEAKEFLAGARGVVQKPGGYPVLQERDRMPVSAMTETVSHLMRNFAHQPPIHIIDTPSEVPGIKVGNNVLGFVARGRIYLVRSTIRDTAELSRVLWHELLHYGIRRFLTREQYVERMFDLARSDRWIQDKAQGFVDSDQGKSLLQAGNLPEYVRARGVDEALAELAESIGETKDLDSDFRNQSAIARAARAVIRWLAKMAERLGFHHAAVELNGLTNDQAAQYVRYVFTALERDLGNFPSGFTADAAFAQRRTGREAMERDVALTDKLLSAPFKLARWDRLVSRAGAVVHDLNERATEAAPVYEAVRAGVESNYGLPEAYIDRRIEMQVNLQRWARGAVTMLDKIGRLTREESRVAYEWMNERDADDLIEQLPEESQATLRELKELIRGLGEEAVRLGQLSREVFDRNELAYLHRSYYRHELEETLAQKVGRRKNIAVWGEQYKGRGLKDWRTFQDLSQLAEEKLDPMMLKGKKFVRLELRAAVRDAVTGDLQRLGGRERLGRLRKVVYWPEGKAIPAKYAGWRNDGLWEVRWFHGGKWGLWRDLNAEEREALGEIDEVRFGVAKTIHLMTHDIEVGRMQEWVAEQYAKPAAEPGDRVVTAREAEGMDWLAVYRRNVWVKVPDSKIEGTNTLRYGALAGKLVPGPIWNDIRQHVSLGRKGNAFTRLWDDVLRMWKMSKTALSPGVHTNNVMANFFLADFHDLRAKDLVKAVRVMLDNKIGKPSEENGDLYRRFEDSGALHGMFKYHELKKEALDPLLEEIRREAIGDEQLAMTRVLSLISMLNALERTGKAAKKFTVDALVDAYSAEDEVFRLAMFIKATRHGLSDLEAGKLARQSFLDYDINAPWIQALRRTAFPFIAFPYRSIPIILHTFATKPWKPIKYMAWAYVLNTLAYAMLGLGEGDEDRERKLLPEEKQGKIWGMFPKMLRMPWNGDAEAPVFLDLRRWYPAGDIFDVGGTHAVLPWSPTALPGGPLALLAELYANKAQFTGEDITLETDTLTERLGKTGLHLYRFAAPNLFMIPGTWSFEGLRGAAGFGEAGRQTDVFGREMSVPQAFGSALGVKLGTYPEDVMRYNLVRKNQAQSSEIMGNIYKMLGERQRNKISDEQLREGVRAQMEKLKALQEDLKARVQPPERP